MCVLIFCTTFVWNISDSQKNSGRYYHKCTLGKGKGKGKGKGETVPLQAWTDPERSRKLRFPDFVTRHRMVVGCQPNAPAAFTLRKCSWYSFLLEAECDRKYFTSMKNSNDTTANRTRDLSAGSAVPQPNAPPRAPNLAYHTQINYSCVSNFVLFWPSRHKRMDYK